MIDALNDTVEAEVSSTDIAVVGMAGRFPGARNVSEFWENLCAGVESITSFTDEDLKAAGVDRATLRNPNYVKSGAVLADVEMFDASFFGFSPRDAAIMDPQHRHFLECIWEALESAGHPADAFSGTIGVFAGSGQHAYLMYNLLTNPALMQSVGMFLVRHTGNDKDFLTTRASYLLNLTGPSVNVQTACSTSLVAIHIATQSLLNGECDIALAGGVTIEVPHGRGYQYQEGEILSPDGHCRAFDARSQGTIFGSGVGIVALRRLTDAIADGDTIHAVIKGSAVNNDGSLKAGYLAPSVEGQAKAVSEALAIAGVEAESITYVEAHGTGTPVGDPIEVAALTQAFRGETDATAFCSIGSLKTNIGHLDTAAGVAAFIKTVKALESGLLPASLNYESPNPSIDFASSPFYVNSALTSWKPEGFPRRAGVNSLGVGGTNAFVILEEPPVLPPTSLARRSMQVLTLSARSEPALDAATANLARYLRAHPELNLADVAYTLQVGRKAFAHRRVVACRATGDAAEALERRDPKQVITRAPSQADPSIVFMFPGGGAQYPNMGRELYDAEPLYREVVDTCLESVQPQLGCNLKRLMFPVDGCDLEAVGRALEKPSVALPALFITEYALARLWMSWGIKPAAMTGHSLGEYTAACLAGVMSVDDALSLVALRGRLFETLPEGAMVSVRCTEERLRPLLDEELDLAAINGPELCLASGPVEAIERLEQRLKSAEIEHSRLKISVAAHSRMLEPILEEFGRRVASFRFRPPAMRWVSNLTGAWITAKDATDPGYWVRHLRHAVRFSDGVRTLLGEPNRLFVEVGPGQTLASLVKSHLTPEASQHAVIGSTRHPRDTVSDVEFLLTSLGRLWAAGVTLDWAALHQGEQRRRVELPTYPFERQRYWIEPGQSIARASEPADPLAKVPDLDDWFYRPVWKRAPLVQRGDTSEALVWLVFRDELGLGDEIARRLHWDGHRVISVSAGEAFGRLGDTAYVLNPAERTDYDALVASLARDRAIPQRIAHLWSVTSGSENRSGLELFEASQSLGFYSLLFLAQALGSEGIEQPLHIGVVSNQLQPVNDAVFRPERATIFGPCKVIPREYPDISCQSLDVVLPHDASSSSTFAFEAAARQVIAELASLADEPVVSYREGERWVEHFEAAGVGGSDAQSNRLREGGVYLITGGLGGIGLVQAEYLARAVQARLVLVGRSGLPDRDEWDQWLATHTGREATSQRITKIRALEALGAEVMVVSADVSNLDQMRSVVATVHERFGAIHGVIHAAGILNDGVIQLKSREIVESVMAPKVRGALVLDAALEGQALDFFILFASTSSILGPAGQVDYAGANAFLNAFAHSKAGGSTTRTVAVDWGVWQEVGMAVRAAGATGRDPTPALEGEVVGHPLLGLRTSASPQGTVYSARYSTAEHWVFDEHRMRSGEPLIPGTGLLEIARAAVAHANGTGAVELADVFLVSPLVVADGEHTNVRVTVEQDGPDVLFSVKSAASTAGTGQSRWQEHARATVTPVDPAGGTDGRRLDDIRARCNLRQVVFKPDQQTKQEEFVTFGPRWRVLRRVDFGSNEALAWLVLPAQFSADLDAYKAHPAMLDIAAHVGLPLIPGYEQSDDFYVPFSCKRVRFREALPESVYSHVRYRAQSSQGSLAVFDVCLMDARGTVLVEIEEFVLKRVRASELASVRRERPRGQAARVIADSSTTSASLEKAPDLLRLGLTEGILPSEGVEVLSRILGARIAPQVVASSIDLHALIEQTEASNRASGKGASGSTRQADPETGSAYVAPRNDVERKLARHWEELMGLDRVGIHDDFFELGGYSLIAVRLFAKLKKTFGVDLSLDTLFQASTIARCAEIIADELGIELETTGTVETAMPTTNGSTPTSTNGSAHHLELSNGHGTPVVNGTNGVTYAATNTATSDRRSSAWSPLVAIQPNGHRMPFFCVHGAGGNVLVFRDLSRRLGTDQPFYGLQAQGVDGKLPPLERIEDMASQYLERIRQVQPTGPYLLGGYSGGGVVAFEMAQQLRERGEGTSLVVLLDTFHPQFRARRLTSRERLRNLSEHGFGYLLEWPKRVLDRQAIRAKMMEANSYSSRGLIVPLELRESQIYQTFHQVQTRYQPRPYPGKVVLFRAADINPIYDHAGPDLGWMGVAVGGLEVHEISGAHDTLVLAPNVDELVERLKACLEGAQARTPFAALAAR